MYEHSGKHLTAVIRLEVHSRSPIDLNRIASERCGFFIEFVYVATGYFSAVPLSIPA